MNPLITWQKYGTKNNPLEVVHWEDLQKHHYNKAMRKPHHNIWLMVDNRVRLRWYGGDVFLRIFY